MTAVQLEYGIKRGAEAAVHGACLFLKILKGNEVLLKLDFKTAFNSMWRDKMLNAVKQLVPVFFLFTYSHATIDKGQLT